MNRHEEPQQEILLAQLAYPRRHDLDALRAFAMLLGIALHAGLSFVPEAEVDDYTIVHVGFGITKVDEESAHETLALMKEMGVLEAELDATVALAKEEAIADDPAIGVEIAHSLLTRFYRVVGRSPCGETGP